MYKIRIGDYFEVFDGAHATPKKTDEGPVYLGIDAVTNDGKINPSGYAHLSEEDYVKWSKRIKPQYGDLVFSYEATLGRYALIPKDFYGCLGRRLALLRAKNNCINIKWLYYYFLSPEWNAYIINHTVKGSTVNRISVEDFPDFEIPYIDRGIQDRIVNVLSAIDAKIDSNVTINDNLQQMATTAYMHLFHCKKSNGRLGDILIENPKSTIQVGEAKDKTGDFPFFTSGDSILRWTEPIVDGRNTFLNTGGNADVKFYVGKTAYSTDTWCITARNDMEDYLYLLLNSIRQELNLKYFQGTGLKHLQKPLLKDRAVYIPSNSEISSFNAEIKPWLTMISNNTRESYRLSALRDWLLPMLMNGQATIAY